MARFVPRNRKQKAIARAGNKPREFKSGSTDSNQIELVGERSLSNDEYRIGSGENSKSQQILKSSQKKKRLEKYIDKKLRKEDSLNLIKKLAAAKVDTSQLRSTTSLGLRPSSRHRIELPLSGDNTEAKNDRNGSRDPSPASQIDDLQFSVDIKTSSSPSASTTFPVAPKINQGFGSGLKRPLNVDEPSQMIPKRRRQAYQDVREHEHESEDSWSGIESTDATDSASSSQGDRTEASDTDASKSEVEDNSSLSEVDSIAQGEGSRPFEERKSRSSAFKAWALEEVNKTVDYVPESQRTINVDQPNGNAIKVPIRQPETDPLPPELQIPAPNSSRQAFSVTIDRSPDIQEARLKLPVVAEEQKIMEAIYNNAIVVVWGATGSGKTTQVPQFLYEAGFGDPTSSNPGMVGVTQPRRVAAVSTSKRVAEELSDAKGRVSYQIRFDTTVSHNTAIKFMTDGILLREIAHDFSLSKYSVIVIDEAHERSTNTDILIGMISRIVDLREDMSKEDDKVRPLRLVIMSATLRISDFLENPNLFRRGPPPLLQAEGRQHPVTTHFARKTQRDYIEEAFHKVCKGHRKLPPGGILVFLTGQNEIETLGRRLEEALADGDTIYNKPPKALIMAKDAPLEAEDVESYSNAHYQSLDEGYMEEDTISEDLIDDDRDEFDVEATLSPCSKAQIVPLFSQLQTKDQLRVFQPPPEDTRMIILATNVAETSLTIPGVRYVFDCGRAKFKTFDPLSGIQSFEVGWISKASATQRAGRAGRTGPGHCYRLYSSAVFERDFEDHTQPEILRMPVEGIVLQLKSMDLQRVANFPFPTPPDRHSLVKAEQLLSHIGAISSSGKLTALGQTISSFPLSPRYSKMLAIGDQHDCMSYTVALVAALATPNIFIPEGQIRPNSRIREGGEIYTNEDSLADERQERRQKAYRRAHHTLSIHSSTCDAMKSLTALCAYACSTDKSAFCEDMFLSPKSMAEAVSLYSQLVSIVQVSHARVISNFGQTNLSKVPSPSKIQISALQQILAAAFVDQVAILASEAPSNGLSDVARRPSRAIDVPYLPLFPIQSSSGKGSSSAEMVDNAVYIHPSSLLAQRPVKNLPTYIVYRHLQRAAPSTIGDASSSGQIKQPKTRMHALTTVTGRQLASLARGTPLLEYGKPIGRAEETEMGKKRTCWVVPSLVNKKGGAAGWPLPAVKVIQKKTSAGWEVDRVIG